MDDALKSKSDLINEVEYLRQLLIEKNGQGGNNNHIEAAFRESEKKFRLLLDSVFDAVIIHENGVIIDANQRLVEMFGYPISELIGMNVFDLAAPESRELIKSNLISGNEEPYAAEGIKKDGTIIEGQICGRTIPYQGRWVRISAIREYTSYKRTEAALKDSEKKYQTLVDNVLVGVYQIKTNGELLYANEALAKIFGFNKPEEIAWQPKENTQIDWDIFQNVSKLLRETGKINNKELTVLTKTGQPKEVLFSATLDGDVISGMVIDITERKRAEEALREGEERYRSLFEGMPIGLYRTALEGKFLEVNPALVAMLGYPDRETLYGLNTVDLYVEPADRDRWIQHMAEDGVVKSFDTRLFRADGSIIWVRENSRVVKDSKNKIMYYEGSIEDITERKLTVEALTESEERYRSLIQTSPDAITLTDMRGNLLMLNQGSAELFGFSSVDEALASGKNAFDFIFPDERKRALENLQKTLKAGSVRNEEYRLIKNDGSSFPGELTATVILDSKGKPKAFVAIIRDISERKQIEEILHESRERYRSLFENSPISLWEEDFSEIKGYIDYIKETGINDFRDYFEKHPEEVATCASMVRVVDVNNATIDLYHAASKDEFMRGLDRFFAKETAAAFKEELVAIAEGKNRFEIETSNQTLDGRKKYINMTWTVAPGHENTFSKIFVSIIDVTERKRAEEELRRSVEMLQKTLEGTVHALAVTSEKRDPYTAGHQQRVTKLATAIAREMRLSNEQIEAIRLAGLLHDIGKISIPAELLIKPGPLAETEMGIIRAHALIGYEILRAIPFAQPIAKIVLQHHEKLNGSGYPYGITGDQMLLEAKIIVVADVVEAMASHRPYRPAHGIDKALREIVQHAGVLFDTDVVEACLKVFTQKAFSFI